MSETISFTVPLPPPSLRANSRAHWATKKRDADAYSEVVVMEFVDSGLGLVYGYPVRKPWKRARVRYTWRSCGVQPDHGNLGANTKYLQDILAVAPKLAPQVAEKYKRWHLGLIENDAGIIAEYRMEKVKHKDQEGVLVEIERL